jgi:hypothetical protein
MIGTVYNACIIYIKITITYQTVRKVSLLSFTGAVTFLNEGKCDTLTSEMTDIRQLWHLSKLTYQ